jgi:hypothetical protein
MNVSCDSPAVSIDSRTPLVDGARSGGSRLRLSQCRSLRGGVRHRTVPDLARMQADAARAGVDAATIDAFFRQFLERSIA